MAVSGYGVEQVCITEEEPESESNGAGDAAQESAYVISAEIAFKAQNISRYELFVV